MEYYQYLDNIKVNLSYIQVSFIKEGGFILHRMCCAGSGCVVSECAYRSIRFWGIGGMCGGWLIVIWFVVGCLSLEVCVFLTCGSL